jgi:two-component system, NtrC family, sensor kinase
MTLRLARVGLMTALLAVFAAGWLYLFINSRTVDAARQSRTLDTIKDMLRLDAQWSADVLRSAAEINRSYDPLTGPIQVFQSALALLEEEAARLNNPQIKQTIEAAAADFDAKTTTIDRFKAQNSLLKNSLRYTPTANMEIRTLMHSQRDAGLAESARLARSIPLAIQKLDKTIQTPGQDPASDSMIKAVAQLRESAGDSRRSDAAAQGAVAYINLEDSVGALIHDSLVFSNAPEQGAVEALKSSANRLRELSGSYSPQVREAIHNLIQHVEAIRNLRVAQSDLLAEISKSPLAQHLDAVNAAFTKSFDTELQQQARYSQALLWYSAVVLVLLLGGSALFALRLVTEQKRLETLVRKQTRDLRDNESQLIHAQRMSALGETVAGIAHEINTPLAAVKSGLQSTRDLLPVVSDTLEEVQQLTHVLAISAPRDEVQQDEVCKQLSRHVKRLDDLLQELQSCSAIESIDMLSSQGIDSIEHIHQVVVNMLDFSRVDRSRVAKVKIEEAIERTLLMANHLLKRTQLFKRYLNTAPVSIDVAQMNQVVLNLLKNAAEAVPTTGGEIRIETGMEGSDTVFVRITDNGSGIPPALLQDIWEPFFTTKKGGSGTGLGLSTSKRIVDAHSGRIEVASKVGVGTIFTLRLPAVATAAAADAGDIAPAMALHRD